MEELELSIMSRGLDPVGGLRPLLDEFEAQHHCRVQVRVLLWETAWADLVKFALYSHGPDVSEVGMNWVGNLVAMGGLRPFLSNDVARQGGAAAFLASAWASGSLVGDKRLWAMPWLADTRLVYYRRDLLEKAGVDESTAFQSPQNFEQTLDRLQASGVAVPWVVPTQQTSNTLHNLASWVWAAGGDFVNVGNKRVQFNQPQARAGMRAYLGLYRYLAPSARHLNARQSDSLYQRGQAAVTMSGPWLMLVNSSRPTKVILNTGITLPPGASFVGGSSLVVWKHSRYERTAVELVRFLNSREAQAAYCPRAGLLPVRLDVLNVAPYVDRPYYQVMSQGLKTGRSFPTFPAWGLIEDSLNSALTQLWADVLADPHLDLEAAIAERFDSLAHGLDLTLSQTMA